MAVGAALSVPLRRVRRAKGMSADAKARRDEFLGLTAGMTRTIAGARLRSLIHRRRCRAEIRREAVERATQLAVEQLGSMKGLSMKLGQMMSYLNVLPEEGEGRMAELQAAVPPMAPDLVAAVIHEQFGEGPATVFADFEPEPIAAAAVGPGARP